MPKLCAERVRLPDQYVYEPRRCQEQLYGCEPSGLGSGKHERLDAFNPPTALKSCQKCP